jgi:hypothetical protein
MMRDFLISAIAAIAITAVVSLTHCTSAKAHDPEHKVTAEEFWINKGGYKNSKGIGCCGKDDCFPVPVTQVRVTTRGYALWTGEVIPYDQTQLSEDGQYWRCHDHQKLTRCFFAPIRAAQR